MESTTKHQEKFSDSKSSLAVEQTPWGVGGLSFLGGFLAEIGWPSVRDALAGIPASQGVGLDESWGPFQFYNSVILFLLFSLSCFLFRLAWLLLYFMWKTSNKN
ncbi:Hypothetical predicted protein [Podarcis lilfordi]|uniref:Uncharacterized protein n=1 Tax=Podarcis lilfordi TaxID=74358 RepID=A0AA35KTF5_9SAUR|nr:Hypothetical predicted protein [Podarcis lilfordi]